MKADCILNILCLYFGAQEILGAGKMMPYRSKRSLLVPPMFVPENQRAPFPRSIGKVRLRTHLQDES